jgi:phospho-N-acetylmuramoyl-pentapeptide-transferase
MLASLLHMKLNTQICASFVVAFIILKSLMPTYIRIIKKKMATQSINKFLENTGEHITKQHTPTMGGLLIVFSSLASFLLFGEPSNTLCHIVILGGLCFTAIGFFDDYAKIKRHNNKGMMVRARLYMEFASAGIILFLVRKVIGVAYQGDHCLLYTSDAADDM